MEKSLRILYIILFFGLMLNCHKRAVTTAVQMGQTNAKIPDVILYDFSYHFTSKGRSVWVLSSQKADVFRDEDLIKVDGVHLIFYQNGKPDTIVDARFGEVKEKEKILSAMSNVILRTHDNSILKTEILHWNDSTAKLYTDEFVMITRPNGDVIQGYGMEADNNLEKMIIKKRVKGLLYEKKKDEKM
ncbi:MAG: LPS export ABC transporter periplasmic protein LptC [Spirochaetes bacterium]|nr:LPS export ABC transporter periplasmic protein LptC [Spirochaetota bacterium]